MKKGFYRKLALQGIRKNKRLYTPYILTCTGMVMMYYIVYFLTVSDVVQEMPGGGPMITMLSLGSGVLAFFAALFLFYTNSFLIRQRKKEFGLYNILGMDKRNIARVLFWEAVIIAIISLLAGLAAGIGLSKLFELVLINMMSGEASFHFQISVDAITNTAVVFGIIFALLFLNGLRQVSLSNPAALLRSENAGDKPPKANWFLGLVGVAVLACAYYISVSIEEPLSAMLWFFVAVVMVIAATYLLFIAGSVVLCRILQKNKRYYYKANHFISVSAMAYRMKRNGAGLASICILLTMVLVMLSSTATLFIGVEDSLHTRYPRDIVLTATMQKAEYVDEETVSQFRDMMQDVLDEYGAQPQNVCDYRYGYTEGVLADGVFAHDAWALQTFGADTYSDVIQLFIVPVSDYNHIMGANETLEPDEVLIYANRMSYTASTFQMASGEAYRVKAVVDDWINNGESTAVILPSVVVFVPDYQAAVDSLMDEYGDSIVSSIWYYSFDLDLPGDEQVEFFKQIRSSDWYRGLTHADLIYNASIESLENSRDDFYGLYGGLFYLGILLSIIFLAAAVLIIYYKQTAEGYEDQKRFEIMQKVGMTKREIRKSINSQMLTVFFLPLVMAGIHLCFAFPIIHKLLLLFNILNTGLLITSTGICFVIFSVFYTVVYRITSNAYFSIVSGAKDE